eukprot:NODE_1316_length_969_cov_287.961957_g1011_i0.p1 GENE.NODE_1316_length_969_cov_287.961957_g1011_i0~~NODE_1316_length_969_cov_287.961957_g1011_i0.p1  ORF type:complete len:268 (-),score=43.03 NODE_1316_length_969_cov_287.961957_g1011_i0:164-916(-)
MDARWGARPPGCLQLPVPTHSERCCNLRRSLSTPSTRSMFDCLDSNATSPETSQPLHLPELRARSHSEPTPTRTRTRLIEVTSFPRECATPFDRAPGGRIQPKKRRWSHKQTNLLYKSSSSAPDLHTRKFHDFTTTSTPTPTTATTTIMSTTTTSTLSTTTTVATSMTTVTTTSFNIAAPNAYENALLPEPPPPPPAVCPLECEHKLKWIRARNHYAQWACKKCILRWNLAKYWRRGDPIHVPPLLPSDP